MPSFHVLKPETCRGACIPSRSFVPRDWTAYRHALTTNILAGNLLFSVESALILGGAEWLSAIKRIWREQCPAAANETDSNTLGSLVQELTNASDERDQNWRAPINPFRDSRAVA